MGTGAVPTTRAATEPRLGSRDVTFRQLDCGHGMFIDRRPVHRRMRRRGTAHV
ncbi:hypothetical protein ACOT81_36815 [Streptomyces sp. WI04-05B]|uniref:hypothetical protein n=1 Tax=Streptomyces TaxID=1883 RepID=UPI0029B9C4A3|nr:MULTISPECIES: hypothetical protein [unclassified Streptomyces]MDX2546450.1 hypothetical protein [Streptomyces sp. WI04-05B]MDX2586189.1 hypothetical protein [Streptomyces sp. WI04-05A]MDX3748840.1 hypothetical protein [Streptomyces sp. AK08-02]